MQANKEFVVIYKGYPIYVARLRSTIDQLRNKEPAFFDLCEIHEVPGLDSYYSGIPLDSVGLCCVLPTNDLDSTVNSKP